MTPREVDQLDAAELRAFWDLLETENREAERQARRARRGR
jgi:hypothetical protein